MKKVDITNDIASISLHHVHKCYIFVGVKASPVLPFSAPGRVPPRARAVPREAWRRGWDGVSHTVIVVQVR